ncbi:MAG: hypothetical protein DLM59_10740 [Pseudonocardiales bacterium]|nr:MAG: hypothetical protein DLM59_10740 [Pseudonocardiales bacterium]
MTEDSWAANQIRSEPIPPTPAHVESPSAGTDQPDTAADDGRPAEGQDRPQAGVPEDGVTDLTPAPGTSEGLPAVEGTYVPDVGPGGADVDTDEPPLPGRGRDAR